MHIEVRDATAGDASAVADLFYNTVLNVNVGDYSVAQVEEELQPGGVSPFLRWRRTGSTASPRVVAPIGRHAPHSNYAPHQRSLFSVTSSTSTTPY